MDNEASYYIPKMPMSVPLFDASKNCFSVFYSDGMMADIPADLFYKMFYLKGEETEFDASYGVNQQGNSITNEKKPNERNPDENIGDFIRRNFSKEEIEKEANKAYEEVTRMVKLAKYIGMPYEEFINKVFEQNTMNGISKEQLLMIVKSIWDKA